MESAPGTPGAALKARFEGALAQVVDKLRRDPYVLAAILFGSLAHDVVWEKSDIDLLLVVQEGAKHRAEAASLVEDGVNIHALTLPRSAFRRMVEGSLQGSFMLSAVSMGRLLFTHDPSIAELLADAGGLGAADRAAGLLRAATAVLGAVAKAEKWYRTRADMRYSFFWIMKAVDGLAALETVWHGEVPGREVVQQALRHNPIFFDAVYTGLIDGPKTPEAVGAALQRIDEYLSAREGVVFAPILAHLAEAGGARSASDLNHYVTRHLNLDLEFGGLDPALEWLAAQGRIAKVSSPMRLSEKGRVDLEEAAYQSLAPQGGEPA